MTLAQMQARFFELKGKLAVGQIQEDEFKRELEKLRFQDSQGRWWMLGAQSGRWYYYDGARWLLGDPPEPPPPALNAGEPVLVIPPATPTRTGAYPTPNASTDPAPNSAQTISVPYTYAPAQPAPVKSIPVQPPPPAQPNPPPSNGSNVNVPPPPSAAKPSLGETLHQELGKVRMPHVEMPHVQLPRVQMPNLQRPDLHASNIHVPPQLMPHAPAPIRKTQPWIILFGAVVIGLLLVGLMWFAVETFVPGKPISSFIARTLGSPPPQRTPVRQPTVPPNANVENLLRVGDELAAKSQFEPAIAQYQAAAKQAPNEADVYMHWARALALTGRIGEAVTAAQKATRLDPTSAKASAELTRALSWAGQTAQAIKEGENAISLDANNASAKAFLAEAYLRAGRNNEAQDMVNQALELDDLNPDTHRAAGWIAIVAGRKDEGVGEWNRTIELAPETFLYQYELGLVYTDYLKDPTMAIPAYQRAIQLYPPYIPSYTALGRAYLASNQPGPAILQFQKALTLDPNSSEAFLGLGQAFQMSQKCPQAIPYFQKALDLNKDLAAASKGLEDCGAIAKGSAQPPPPPTEVGLAPVATAIPQATVAPINGSGSGGAKPTPAAGAGGDTNPPPPAGKGRIYFPVYDGQYRIYSANSDGSDRRVVVELASSPNVSPDGSRMLFYSWEKDQRGIHRIGTNGTDDLHISLRAEDTLPAWSADGAKYVYATRAGQGADLNKRAFTVRVASTGSKPRQDPAPLISQAQYPAWGPDGRIAFRDCGFPDESCGIAVVNADGGGKKQLTPGLNATAPAWSLDGARIVFMSNTSGNWDLYVVNADGGSPERLTDDPGDDGLPVFSPDGSKIAFAAKRGGVWSIWQMDTDGENEAKLFDLEGEIAGTIPGNSPAQPGQTWLDQRISWR